jgi:uncharacterized tellurite resistance protein B-like protein
MRAYPIDSPRAAARIVALAALADGHLAAAEIETLERLCARSRLGLGPTELREVVHALCEDLLSTADHNWSSACRVDRDALAGLMAEVEDPGLRRTVLELCVAAIEADAHVADGEALVVQAAIEAWQPHRPARVAGADTGERLPA